MMHVHAWRPAVLAALIPVMVLSAAPAFAQDADNDTAKPHMTVAYGDLDLSTAKGRHTLDARLRRSAATVCGYDVTQRPLIAEAAERTCYDRALVHARVSMAAALSKSRVASSQ